VSPPCWTSVRQGQTDAPRGRAAKLLHDNGFAQTALNLDFAAGDDKARRFLRNDIYHFVWPIRIGR
jgi:hypothetical protein